MTTTPTETEIRHLIERAKSHDLGVEFLLNGSLDAVAAGACAVYKEGIIKSTR